MILLRKFRNLEESEDKYDLTSLERDEYWIKNIQDSFSKISASIGKADTDIIRLRDVLASLDLFKEFSMEGDPTGSELVGDLEVLIKDVDSALDKLQIRFKAKFRHEG
jgi:hypothetical protein